MRTLLLLKTTAHLLIYYDLSGKTLDLRSILAECFRKMLEIAVHGRFRILFGML